jgi:hypothetical protein
VAGGSAALDLHSTGMILERRHVASGFARNYLLFMRLRIFNFFEIADPIKPVT